MQDFLYVVHYVSYGPNHAEPFRGPVWPFALKLSQDRFWVVFGFSGNFVSLCKVGCYSLDLLPVHRQIPTSKRWEDVAPSSCACESKEEAIVDIHQPQRVNFLFSHFEFKTLGTSSPDSLGADHFPIYRDSDLSAPVGIVESDRMLLGRPYFPSHERQSPLFAGVDGLSVLMFGGVLNQRPPFVGPLDSDSCPVCGCLTVQGLVRPHESLNEQTPADRAGIKIEGSDNWLTLIHNASKESRN